MQSTRNIAIIAHVDHGKTTLVDALLHQSGLFSGRTEITERVMDSNDLEKERGITIFSKNASIQFGDFKINIVDTPGHADFGGEVERILRMVDGVVLLVDAAEGPMPQTRFVLQKSLALGLMPIVVINKVDRSDARIEEVEDEVLDLFIQLEADEHQLEYPTLYACGRDGICATEAEGVATATNLKCLLDSVVETIPAPNVDQNGATQMLVSNIEHSEFVGRMVVGRLERGKIFKGQELVCINADHEQIRSKVTRVEVFSGLGRTEVQEAPAGEIVAVAGFLAADIGDTLTDPETPEALQRLEVSEPTVAVYFHVNDGPFAGQEGKYVTSRQLRERLWKEALYDQALWVEETKAMDTFRVKGRGELHLSILMENMRREGYEFCVSRPEVLLKEDENGKLLEPVEEAVIDVPNEFSGAIIEKMGLRKGTMEDMKNQGERTRITFAVPTRGLIGLRTEFLSATKGQGLLTHRLREYAPYHGEIKNRIRGVLISMDKCTTVPYAIFNLEDRGEFLVGAGVPVYEGMIVGIHTRPNDLVVNVGKTKKLTNVRASGTDDAVLLTPPRKMSLESYLEFINDDEWIEITPQSIRARKKILDFHKRKQASKSPSA